MYDKPREYIKRVHLNCPYCNGRIIMIDELPTINEEKGLMHKKPRQPVCNKCWKEYTIRINEDLSIDIIS